MWVRNWNAWNHYIWPAQGEVEQLRNYYRINSAQHRSFKRTGEAFFIVHQTSMTKHTHFYFTKPEWLHTCLCIHSLQFLFTMDVLNTIFLNVPLRKNVPSLPAATFNDADWRNRCFSAEWIYLFIILNSTTIKVGLHYMQRTFCPF